MAEDLLDLDVDHEPRRLSVDAELRDQGRVAAEGRPSVHAEGLGDAGDDEEQPDAGPVDDVVDAVEAPVPRELRDAEALLVEDADEAGRAALGRCVGRAVGGRRREDEKRRRRDERLGAIVEARRLLAERPLGRLAEKGAELLRRSRIA